MELIKRVESESVHLILSDIPHGIGVQEWDVLHDKPKHLGTAQKWNRFKQRLVHNPSHVLDQICWLPYSVI